AAAFGVDVRAIVSVEMLAGPVANVDIDRRPFARHRAVGESREAVDRLELITTARNQRAAKVRIKVILAANGDAQHFVRLSCERFSFARLSGGFLPEAFGRTLDEEPV